MVTLKDLETPKKSTWCPGCGNFGILTAVKSALVDSGLAREEIVLVSGIGCHGKMIDYVNINGFHSIHGRVLPVATGVTLANPDIKVIGFSGDGDCYDEGWDHFVHAIRRNVNMTLIVHDNMVFGLTTGQTTATTSQGFKSKSTPYGSITPPLNPLAHALISNATFVARGYVGEIRHLQNLIVQAIKHRGFSYIDVLQVCVSFNYLNTYDWYKKRVYKLDETGHDTTNRQKALEKCQEWGDHIPIGLFYKEDRPSYYDNIPQVRGMNLAKTPTKGNDIGALLEEME
ncbi:MAG: thiamine pyrophosphate-dependent enzyme [Candidatus Atabeyarchaeum deiterrae]